MGRLVAGLVQMRSSRDVAQNIAAASELIRAAARDGAEYVQTPEMTNLLERSRADLFAKIRPEAEDEAVAAFSRLAGELGIHLHIGSLAIRTGEKTAANRAFLFAPDGGLLARYDKIHMFDVDLANGESWRESATYQPGTESLVVDLPQARLGLAVCYDVRFPALFRAQAGAGATMLCAPAAFTRQTGAAHWHVLQRARAIENGAFMLSAAQGGRHEDGRETYGHSLICDPWGKVIAELDHDEPGHLVADLDIGEAEAARGRIPAIANQRDFVLKVVENGQRGGGRDRG
uniref:carbon-nitrogen hydrolase family protein n=1 Tax=Stappia sp. TaxID=1870903 RepID=UPI003BA9AC2B